MTELPLPDDDLAPRPGRLADLAGRARARAWCPSPTPRGSSGPAGGSPSCRRAASGRGDRRWPCWPSARRRASCSARRTPRCSAGPPRTCRSPPPTPSPPSIRCCARRRPRRTCTAPSKALAVAPAAEAPMQLLEVARPAPAAGSTGTATPPAPAPSAPAPDRRPGYDLTLIAAEVLDELAAAGHAARLRRHPAQRPHPRHRRQRPGRPHLPHRRRAVPGPPAVRALRPPRPAQRTRTAAATHPPRRPARRRPHRRRHPARSAHAGGCELLACDLDRGSDACAAGAAGGVVSHGDGRSRSQATDPTLARQRHSDVAGRRGLVDRTGRRGQARRTSRSEPGTADAATARLRCARGYGHALPEPTSTLGRNAPRLARRYGHHLPRRHAYQRPIRSLDGMVIQPGKDLLGMGVGGKIG